MFTYHDATIGAPAGRRGGAREGWLMAWTGRQLAAALFAVLVVATMPAAGTTATASGGVETGGSPVAAAGLVGEAGGGSAAGWGTTGESGSPAGGTAAPSPEDFGYGSMTVDGERARGPRPLLLVLVEFGDADLRPYHNRSYYRALLGNVSEYFTENSRGAFTWSDVTIVGPLTMPDDPETDWDESRQECWKNGSADCADDRPTGRARSHEFVQSALELADDDVDFSAYDDDGDGEVTAAEAGFAVVSAADKPAAGGSNRWPCDDATLTLDDVQLCRSVVTQGEGVGFATFAHELAHQLRTVDIYGTDSRLSFELSLMGATIYDVEDDRRIFHFDPWHKIQLGWVEPQIYSIPELRREGSCLSLQTVAGSGDLEDRDRGRPVILYDPDRYDVETQTGEYYILEGRWPASYDMDVADRGMAVWYVRTDEGALAKLDARIGPNGKSSDDDGTLQSDPAGDDREVDGKILPGPNGRIDTTVPTGDDGKPVDGTSTERMMFSVAPDGFEGGAPTNFTERGDSSLWRQWDGPAALRWFDGSSVGISPQFVERRRGVGISVDLNAEEMRIFGDRHTGEPGAELTVSGHLGAAFANVSAPRQLRVVGGIDETLTDVEWSCGRVTVDLPADIPTGTYRLWAEDPETGVRSNRVDLVLERRVETADWTGSFDGSLDGRRATLTVERSGDLSLRVTVEDRERDVTYRATTPVPTSNVLADLTLESADGSTVELQRLALHDGAGYLSGASTWQANRYGLAFAREDWRSASGADLDRSDPAVWTDQWTGLYEGYVDGRWARLNVSGGQHVEFGTLRPGEGYRFNVTLTDLDRDVTYRGTAVVDTTDGTGDAHLLAFDRLRAANETLNDVRLRLHTWNTAHVSGTARVGEDDPGYGPTATTVGVQFTQVDRPSVDPDLLPIIEAVQGDSLPGYVRPLFGGERINVHLDDGVVGVKTSGDGRIETVSGAAHDDPTMNVLVPEATADDIRTAADPRAAAREAFLDGEISYHGTNLGASVKLTVAKVATGVVRVARGVGNWVGNLPFV